MMNLKVMVNGLQSGLAAEQLIALWKHDEGSLQFWRASSNFVYAFEHEGQLCFLRFTHEHDHSIEQIHAELAFMNYLLGAGYPSVRPIRSVNGQFAETVTTDDGTYFGSAFTRALGSPVDLESMTELQIARWGQSLGRLHALSRSYEPDGEKRKDWRDIVMFIRNTLLRYPAETAALVELERVEAWLAALPCSSECYGLIHYDLQPDNVFWEEERQEFQVFDFDDAMYHWFAMDIAAALVDLLNEDGNVADSKLGRFLDGYRSEFPLSDDMVSLLPRFLRFHSLYGFTRLLRSLEGSEITTEFTWYDGLSEKLAERADELRQGFLAPW